MGKRVSALILIVCITTLSNGAAFADEFHYTNLLIGDRAPGMGGAYTAVSDDATGLYYNPAGVAYTAGRNLSASVNAYYYTTKTYRNVIGGNGWERTSSSLLPNYFGVVQPLGGWKFGFSYAVPESIMSDQQQTFHDLQLGSSLQPINPGVTISTYIINFNEERNTYNFGPSVAKELTDKLSAGLTLYIYERKSLSIMNQIIKLSNGGSELTNDYRHEYEWGLRPVLGGMWSPVDTLSVGVAVSRIFLTHSNTNFQHAVQSQGFATGTDANGQVINGVNNLPDGQSATSARRHYPTQVNAGVAWFPSPSLLIAADINYFTEVDEQIISMGGQLVQLRPHTDALTNISLGTEYYLSKNWAVRAGFYTDYANTPEIAGGGTDQSEHIDIYGVTASVSHYTGNTSVTLGAGKTYGKGQAQIAGGVTSVQTAVVDGWMLFLSSSYSY